MELVTSPTKSQRREEEGEDDEEKEEDIYIIIIIIIRARCHGTILEFPKKQTCTVRKLFLIACTHPCQ